MGQQGSLYAETNTPEVSTYTQLSHKQWAGPKHHSWKLSWCTQVTTHVHSHSRTQEAVTLWLTFSTNDSVFCFTYFHLTKFWKGQGGTVGPNSVYYSDLLTQEKRLRFLWSSTWEGWMQQWSFDEQEVWFWIHLYLLLVLWLWENLLNLSCLTYEEEKIVPSVEDCCQLYKVMWIRSINVQ